MAATTMKRKDIKPKPKTVKPNTEKAIAQTLPKLTTIVKNLKNYGISKSQISRHVSLAYGE